ncbi:DgyrCDS7378 [Dimorphilus gyrociliatus]|uniref:rhomboid protease n=1 Tax=Dimorphilus gyrociliatus TaxID=2664684 RepID=A0A7I8VQW4_9ANNE|nr:DgyrCDS7378 [Dimorphilus gyrociliatus]
MGVGVSLTAYGACMVWQYEILRQKAYSMSKQFTNVHSGIRGQIHSIWKRMKLTEKVAVSIIAINTGVFLAWKVPALSRYMLKYFSSSPYSKAASSSMFFSFWSHYNTFHLLANMYVFWSFSYAAGALLGAPEMVAFFVTSGLLSNYGSYIFKALTHSRVPSLGAVSCTQERFFNSVYLIFIFFFEVGSYNGYFRAHLCTLSRSSPKYCVRRPANTSFFYS